ncbi:MAG: hypothetical protein GWP70_10960 [Proteobacteria bacterium]|nr:hypothetical protein [Pseudomonadota bacterium]
MKVDTQKKQRTPQPNPALIRARVARMNANASQRASSSLFAIAVASALLLALQ